MIVYERDDKGNPTFWSGTDFTHGYNEISKPLLLTDGYCLNPFVAIISNSIGDKAASLPKKFCDIEGNEIDNAETRAFQELLMKGEGEKALLKKCGINLVALGEFFIVKEESIGFSGTSQLEVVSPASVDIQSRSGYLWDNDIAQFNVTDYYRSSLTPDEVIFGKYPNIKRETNRGYSPFESAWDVVQASNNAFQAHGMLVKNMGANGLLSPKVSASDIGAMMMDSDERNLLQRTMDRLFGGVTSRWRKDGRTAQGNFGKTIVSKNSMDFVQIGMDAQKLKILELNQENLRVLAACVSLDSKIFNDPDSSTYNNQTEAEKKAYRNCFVPMTNFVLDVIARDLLPDGIYWVVDTEQIDVLNQRDQAREKETREGIIDIQNQVADGKISVNAGVQMMKTIYDFDEDTATALLDMPEQEPQPQGNELAD